MLQSITPPPVGTTKSAMNNLILAESKKTDSFGPRDVQAIINSLSTDCPEGEGTASSPFQLCRVAGGPRCAWSQGHNTVCGGPQRGHQAAPAPKSGGYSLNVPPGLLYIPIGNVGPNEICNYCKQRGHYKGDCPLKQGHAGGGPSGQKNPEVSGAPAIRLAVPQVEGEGIVDTGAMHHVSGCRDLFVSLTPLEQEIPLKLACDSVFAYASHVGTIRMRWRHSTININKVLYSSGISGTLVLLGQLVEEGYCPRFDGCRLVVEDDTGKLFFDTSLVNWMWMLRPASQSTCNDTLGDRKSVV